LDGGARIITTATYLSTSSSSSTGQVVKDQALLLAAKRFWIIFASKLKVTRSVSLVKDDLSQDVLGEYQVMELTGKIQMGKHSKRE
jgi:hypothetical protein